MPKTRTSSSGCGVRLSTTTNATVDASPTAKATIVMTAVQPCSGPSCSARTSPPTAATASSDPSTSKPASARSEEHTSELQSLMRISYADFCLKKKHKNNTQTKTTHYKR